MSSPDRIAEWLLRHGGGPAPAEKVLQECLRIGGAGARDLGDLREPLLRLLRRDGRFEFGPRGEIRLAPEAALPWQAAAMVPLHEAVFTVVDIETTGTRAESNGITEIAAVRVRNGAILDQYHTLTHPGESIPRFITRMTGITDEMVASAPHFLETIPALLAFLGPSVGVAHNAPFDFGFLRAAATRAGAEPPPNQVLCTVRLARRLLPRLRRRNLDAVSSHFGVRITGRHRALGDATATARVLLRLLEMAAERGAKTPIEVIRMAGRRG